MAKKHDKQTGPKFAKLFPIVKSKAGKSPDDEPEYPTVPKNLLSPRSAFAIYTVLEWFADQARYDIGSYHGQPVNPDDAWQLFDRLPRITYALDEAWRQQMVSAGDNLLGDLAAGRPPLPTCTAEEVWLHLAMQLASEWPWEDEEWEGFTALPAHELDLDIDEWREVLLQDVDALAFWDEAMDGFEDPQSEVNQVVGIGDLRPHTWFTTFGNMTPRQ